MSTPGLETKADWTRIGNQRARVFDLMKDGQTRTLAEVALRTGFPSPSVSARLRDFRKARYGGHHVYRYRTAKPGIYAYQLVVKDAQQA